MLKFVALFAFIAVCTAQKSSDTLVGLPSSGTLEIREALPMEVAPESEAEVLVSLGSETMDFGAPATGVGAPLVHLPKGAQEVVDIPHSDIRLPGNSLQNKDLNMNLPTPVIEAPKPIIQTKDVLFRVPQHIVYVPKPIVQHKPIVYKVQHTLRSILPRVNLKEYLFQVPSVTITGKSSQ